MQEHAQGAEVRLARGSWLHAAHPSCDSPNTLRRFALGALVGENPAVSVPVLCGCEGQFSYDCTAMHENVNVV